MVEDTCLYTIQRILVKSLYHKHSAIAEWDTEMKHRVINHAFEGSQSNEKQKSHPI